MTWFAWTLIALFVLGTVSRIAEIDRPRDPVTRGVAIVSLIFNGLLIIGVMHYFL